VRASIQKLNHNTTPGADGLNAELFKTEENLIRRIWKVMEKSWMEERIPGQWEERLICPIYTRNKGDRLVCENYRGTSLLHKACKVFRTGCSKDYNLV
jgi:hypothetical protein